MAWYDILDPNQNGVSQTFTGIGNTINQTFGGVGNTVSSGITDSINTLVMVYKMKLGLLVNKFKTM